MAALPATVTVSPTVQAIYSWWEAKLDQPRSYLGGSVIGRECERELWYGFHHCGTGAKFEGRMLRLFNRGHREEAVFVEELRGIGMKVHDVDPSTGEQFRFKALGGHAAGGIDGVVLGVPEAPKTWHLLECKTHNEKSFAEIAGKKDDRKAREKDPSLPFPGKGVQAAKPEHYAQMQIYMHWAQLTRALYLAVNKDTDELYAERVRYDEQAAQALDAKAARIIYAAEPPPGISEDPAFYKCKSCPAAQVCHGTTLPAVSCRTCLHATPRTDGTDGDWTCALAPDAGPIPLDFQQTGCPSHLYVPALLARWGAAEDASEAEGWVQYRAPDGVEFRNGPWGLSSFTSKELHALTPALLRNAEFMALRAKHAARVTNDDGGLPPLEEAA